MAVLYDIAISKQASVCNGISCSDPGLPGLQGGHRGCLTCRLHDVEPLEGLEMLPVSQLSRLVASKALRTVPYPLLGENTLCIADSMCLAPDEDGKLALLFRCALSTCPAAATMLALGGSPPQAHVSSEMSHNVTGAPG